MKIARFGDDRIGIVKDATIVDVTRAAGAEPREWPPVAMNRLIANFAEIRPKLEAGAREKGVPLDSVRLLTPVPWPNKIIAYPVNYHEHGVEMGSTYRANNQGFFLKPPSALSGPADPIVLPVNSGRRIDHECELAIVIAKEGRDIAQADWRDYDGKFASAARKSVSPARGSTPSVPSVPGSSPRTRSAITRTACRAGYG